MATGGGKQPTFRTAHGAPPLQGGRVPTTKHMCTPPENLFWLQYTMDTLNVNECDGCIEAEQYTSALVGGLSQCTHKCLSSAPLQFAHLPLIEG